jgi:hypothetical protein
MHIVNALDALGFVPGSVQSGAQKTHENGNDRHDSEKLDYSEPAQTRGTSSFRFTEFPHSLHLGFSNNSSFKNQCPHPEADARAKNR